MTAWLSALLLFSAVFGLPVTHAAYTNRTACYYVYSMQRERRAVETIEAAKPPHPDPRSFVVPAPRDGDAAVLLDFALFQRPPPALTC